MANGYTTHQAEIVLKIKKEERNARNAKTDQATLHETRAAGKGIHLLYTGRGRSRGRGGDGG